MEIKNYLKIARPNHWFKNILILPGLVLALLIFPQFSWALIWKIPLAFISVCLITSANYVINEWLDAEFDKFHPLKKNRPSVTGGIEKKFVYWEYSFLAAVGLGLAALISVYFLAVAALLLVMGIIYNVKPFRTKDRVYVDVLSESFNNPIRFLLGWFIITDSLALSSSLIIAYWMAGAFLMAVKRYAEYRFIGNKEQAGLYRRSFRYYDENNLLLSVLFYAMTFAFFFGVFVVKHRIELLVALPLFSILFCWYLALGMKNDSPAQRPEELYREKGFAAFIVFIVLVLTALLYFHIPLLNYFLQYNFLLVK
ncbi:MAG TPA: UbiA prenyltransferase family protein [Candidatus Methylomirabilis sp.]|nr:UbiA prenyltransferase family protein [Candidatus Methylomirabilis sp.]